MVLKREAKQINIVIYQRKKNKIEKQAMKYSNPKNTLPQALSALAAVAAACPLRRPVLLAAMRPTF